MTDRRDDHFEIGEVLIRYATAIDQRDWELFGTCWTADASAAYSDFGSYPNVEALTDAMARTHDSMGLTHHRLSNFAIDVDGDNATARSYVHAVLLITPDDPSNWVDTIGRYDDELVRTPGGWRIARRTSTTARMLTNGPMFAGQTQEA